MGWMAHSVYLEEDLRRAARYISTRDFESSEASLGSLVAILIKVCQVSVESNVMPIVVYTWYMNDT